MSHYDYEMSKALAAPELTFDAIVMGAMRRADRTNLRKLVIVFPELWAELAARYDAPGGWLLDDPELRPRDPDPSA